MQALLPTSLHGVRRLLMLRVLPEEVLAMCVTVFNIARDPSPLAGMRSTIQMDYFAVDKLSGLQIKQQAGHFSTSASRFSGLSCLRNSCASTGFIGVFTTPGALGIVRTVDPVAERRDSSPMDRS